MFDKTVVVLCVLGKEEKVVTLCILCIIEKVKIRRHGMLVVFHRVHFWSGMYIP